MNISALFFWSSQQLKLIVTMSWFTFLWRFNLQSTLIVQQDFKQTSSIQVFSFYLSSFASLLLVKMFYCVKNCIGFINKWSWHNWDASNGSFWRIFSYPQCTSLFKKFSRQYWKNFYKQLQKLLANSRTRIRFHILFQMQASFKVSDKWDLLLNGSV